jgi:hypothetical protein
VTAIFGEPQIFGWYVIGFAACFFGYLVVASRTGQKTGPWIGDPED